MPANSFSNILGEAECDGQAAYACVLKFMGGIDVVHCWACELRALTSRLMRDRFNPCLVAAAGIPSVD